MKTNRLISMILMAVYTALLVAACGGGGGGGGGGVSITAVNAEQITAEIVKSVDLTEGISSGSNFLTGLSVNTAASGFNYPDFFVKQLLRLPALASQLNTGSVTGVVIQPMTHNCTELTGGTSGTYTESGNISDPLALSVGDMYSVDFNSCTVDGIVLNGAMSLTVTTVTPNFDGMPPYTLGIDAVLTAFTANDAGFVISGDGNMSMLLDEDIGSNFTLTLAGTSLLVSAAGDAERLTNYQFVIFSNVISGDFSADLIGTIDTTVIGGSVSFDTTVPFSGNDFVGTGDPTAGLMLITTSADNSHARVTALSDGIAVQIEVDADGDSLYESTIMTTWAALQNP